MVMLITNGKLITWENENRILEGYALYFKDEKITDIGPEAELIAKYPQVERLDAKGHYVMPGNICAHTHFYGAFARGMAIPGEAPSKFIEILRNLWWPLDMALDADAVMFSTLVCLLDAIRHGTTTLFDHHASPNFIDGSLDVVADAVERSGLRAVLSYEVTDRNGPQGVEAGIRENVRFIKSKMANPNSKIQAAFGLHAPLTLSDKTLEACREAKPDSVGFHLHVAESKDDKAAVLERANTRPIDWLNQYDILGPKSIIAHGVHLNEAEIDQIAETGTWVTHQPRSNMNNAVGVSEVENMLNKGVRVGLGNDGFSNAMWEEWKATYLMHKLAHQDPRRMNGYTVADIAIYNNSALASTYFTGAAVGVLKPGAYADLIFVNYNPFTPMNAGNLPWHIIFGFHESMVTTTIVAGKILMRDRKILSLDEGAITAKALELAPQVWERYQKFVGTY
jgi:putative selenium metabolism protein SsnA